MRRFAVIVLVLAVAVALPPERVFAQGVGWALLGTDDERVARVAEQACGWYELPLPELDARCAELLASVDASPEDGLGYLLAIACVETRALRKTDESGQRSAERGDGGGDGHLLPVGARARTGERR